MQATESSPLIKAIQIDVILNMSNPTACFNIYRMNPKGSVEAMLMREKTMSHSLSLTWLFALS